MNAEPYSFDDLILMIRATLTNRGAVGQWLLKQIDETLEEGVEALSTSQPSNDLWSNITGEANTGEQTLEYRRPGSSREILKVYIDVLYAYLVVLPSCYERAKAMLQEHGVEEAAIGFYDELAPGIPNHDPVIYVLTDMYPDSWHQNRALFGQLEHLLEQIKQ